MYVSGKGGADGDVVPEAERERFVGEKVEGFPAEESEAGFEECELADRFGGNGCLCGGVGTAAMMVITVCSEGFWTLM